MLVRYGLPDIKSPKFIRSMTYYYVPKEFGIINLPKRIYMNKDMKIVFHQALTNVFSYGIQNDIKSFDGCFNLRPVRGYEDEYRKALIDNNVEEAIKYLSKHSWGMAIDINAYENQLGQEGKMSEHIVRSFKDAGFIWGGDFKRKDPMHFEL